MYSQGKGVPQSYEEAIKWYKKAAKQDNSNAQYLLGKMYFQGKGIKKNINEAKKLFKSARNNGVEKACSFK